MTYEQLQGALASKGVKLLNLCEVFIEWSIESPATIEPVLFSHSVGYLVYLGERLKDHLKLPELPLSKENSDALTVLDERLIEMFDDDPETRDYQAVYDFIATVSGFATYDEVPHE